MSDNADLSFLIRTTRQLTALAALLPEMRAMRLQHRGLANRVRDLDMATTGLPA